MVDARYIIVVAILIVATVSIYRYPRWAVAVTVGLAAAALAYTILFGLA